MCDVVASSIKWLCDVVASSIKWVFDVVASSSWPHSLIPYVYIVSVSFYETKWWWTS